MTGIHQVLLGGGGKMPFGVGTSGANWATTGALSVPENTPSTAEEGDLRVFMGTIEGTGTWTPPSGWTEVLDNSNSAHSIAVMHKVLVSGDGTASFAQTGGLSRKNVILACMRNAAYGSIGTPVRSTTDTITLASMTAQAGMLLLFHRQRHSTNLAITPPPGFEQFGNVFDGATLFAAPCAAGATGTLDISLAGTPSGGQIAVLINVVPSP